MMSLLFWSLLSPSFAAPLSDSTLFMARETPWLVDSGEVGLGLFQPLVVGLNEKVAIIGPSVVGLAAPRLGAKVSLFQNEHSAVAFRGSVGYPTPALNLAKGWTIPSNRTVGPSVLANIGVLAGYGTQDWALSGGVEGRFGLGGGDLYPADLFFYDTAMAPLLEGARLRLHGQFDYFPKGKWGVSTRIAAHLGGVGPDINWRTFGMRQLGAHMSLGLGLSVASEQLSYGRKGAIGPLFDLHYSR